MSAPIFIGIAGPSGAGKSTVCRSLLSRYGDHLSRLKLDDFFCDASEVQRHPLGFAYWDHPESIKWDALVQAMTELKEGRPTAVPHYRRELDRVDGVKIVVPSRLMLVDGYQVLYDDRVRELLDLSFYFDLPEDAQVTRRMERQPDVDVGYLYHVMLPAARAFLWPTRRFANYIVDATPPPEQVLQQCVQIFERHFAVLRDVPQKKIPASV